MKVDYVEESPVKKALTFEIEPERVQQEIDTRAREFARNAERTKGRSMIVMGAATNHWFHGDTIYRSMLNLLL